jgi:hypothetical protein
VTLGVDQHRVGILHGEAERIRAEEQPQRLSERAREAVAPDT